MKKHGKVIYLSIMLFIIAMSLITITFAWIIVINKTEPIIITTGSIEVKANLFYGKDEDDNNIISADEYKLVDEGGIIFSNIIPGQKFYFKIDIENKGTIPGKLSLSVINIIVSSEIINHKFELSYNDPSTNEEKTISLHELLDDNYLYLFENFVITENGKFSFYFTVTGTSEINHNLMGEFLKINSFLVRLDQIRR